MKKLGRKKVGCYSNIYRSKVISSILEGGLSVYQSSAHYGVSPMTIYRWLNKLEEDQSMSQQDGSIKAEMGSSELEARLKELEEALRLEKLRSACYQEMIKQAEQHYNISIEKKSGSKPSKP